MRHRKLEFPMPASASVVFDAFHYHKWKMRWDSLVSHTEVDDGAPCPSVGAISKNKGGGLLGGLSMTTRFVSYEPPVLAAATMVGKSFPFSRWAASMRHVDTADGHSILVYTYTLEAAPRSLRWIFEPVVDRMFLRATRKRFGRLQAFLLVHSEDIIDWRKNKKAELHIRFA